MITYRQLLRSAGQIFARGYYFGINILVVNSINNSDDGYFLIKTCI